jgi:hypothetical protein
MSAFFLLGLRAPLEAERFLEEVEEEVWKDEPVLDPAVPDVGAPGRIHASQALARARRP